MLRRDKESQRDPISNNSLLRQLRQAQLDQVEAASLELHPDFPQGPKQFVHPLLLLGHVVRELGSKQSRAARMGTDNLVRGAGSDLCHNDSPTLF